MTRIEILGLAVLAILLTVAGNAFAGNTCSYIGNTLYCNGDDGSSVTGSRIGNTDYYNDNQGNTVTCSWIGNTRYCN